MTRVTHHQPIRTGILSAVLLLIVTLGAAGDLLAQQPTRATTVTVKQAQVISVAEVTVRSPAISITKVGREVAPGIGRSCSDTR